MGSFSRTKGKRGELELAGLILNNTGIQLKRNLTQYQDKGGADLLGLSHSIIEVKRYKWFTDGDLKVCWEKTVQEAKLVGSEPILAYRADRQGWRFILNDDSNLCQQYSYSNTVNIGASLFCQMLKKGLIK